NPAILRLPADVLQTDDAPHFCGFLKILQNVHGNRYISIGSDVNMETAARAASRILLHDHFTPMPWTSIGFDAITKSEKFPYRPDRQLFLVLASTMTVGSSTCCLKSRLRPCPKNVHL